MIRRWLSPTVRAAATTAPAGESFECSYCLAVLESWTADCPRCDGLVVRIVDAPE